MSIRMKFLLFTVLSLPLVATADDIVCTKTSNNGDASCFVVPDRDGVFFFEFKAEATGNNQGSPTISGLINVNNKECVKKKTIGWIDGYGSITVSCIQTLNANEGYTIYAETKNTNAVPAGDGAVLYVRRLGK